MIPQCLNHRQITWDFCRNCNGRDLDCPEYLADLEHFKTRQTKPVSSSYLTQSSGVTRQDKNAEKPFYFSHNQNEPSKPNYRMFLSRFRRSDGQ
jgi:hypothetical protein